MNDMLEARMAAARIHGSAARLQGTEVSPERMTPSSQGALTFTV
jgi:hypothetical protein